MDKACNPIFFFFTFSFSYGTRLYVPPLPPVLNYHIVLPVGGFCVAVYIACVSDRGSSRRLERPLSNHVDRVDTHGFRVD